MGTRLKFLYAISLVAALVFQAGCSSGTIADVAKAEAGIEAACNTGFTFVVQANSQGLISTPDAIAINNVILKVEQANGAALTATAKINSLSAADQQNLLSVLNPVVAAINTAVASGTAGIKDPATQQKTLLILTTIQTAVNAAVAILRAAKTS